MEMGYPNVRNARFATWANDNCVRQGCSSFNRLETGSVRRAISPFRRAPLLISA